MGVAVFDYAAWIAFFPEMATVPEPVADGLFAVACLLLDNTDCSPVPDVSARLVYLNYATAHLASLAGYPLPADATVPQPAGVGRVSSATEGSVSISTDYANVRENEIWWVQTQYGATFWQLTRWLRTMRYRAPAPRYFGPAYGLPRRGW